MKQFFITIMFLSAIFQSEQLLAQVRSWDFTNWSDGTKNDLHAEALTVEAPLASNSATHRSWRAFEKWNATDNQEHIDACYWWGDSSTGVDGDGNLYDNGNLLQETAGLKWTTLKAGALAIAVDYPETSLGAYSGAQYLWIGGSAQTFVIPNVMPGAKITIDVESHKLTDGRGLDMSINGTTYAPVEGSNKPKERTTCVWQVPSTLDAETVDVAFTNNNGCHVYNITVTSTPNTTTGYENGYGYVDLGLSVRWATANVGATQPYDYGLYFAWGETTGYTSDTSDGRSFDWENYKWCNGTENTMTKYCTDSIYGTVDNNTTLELADDAARIHMGGNWRMPTKEEQEELRDSCTWTWQAEGNSDYNGVAGYKVTGANGNSIFLPAAGYCGNASLYYAGTYGYYRLASLDEGYPILAYGLLFSSDYVDANSIDLRCYGFTVRAVFPETNTHTETVTAFSSPSFTVTLDTNGGTAQYFSNAYYRLGNGGSLTLKGKSNVNNIVGVKMNLQDPSRSGNDLFVSSGILSGDSITDVNDSTLTITARGSWPQLWLSSLTVTYEGTAPVGTYAIRLPQYLANGSVTSSRDWADEGDVVTLTATPDEGYHLSHLYANRGAVTLSPSATAIDQYTFTMPAEDVTIGAVFAEGEVTTGLKLNVPEDETISTATTIYNLQGQRLLRLQRGVNIVGGPKVIH